MDKIQSSAVTDSRTVAGIIATFDFKSAKEAIEVVDLIGVLSRSGLPIKFISRYGRGKKSIQFWCESETAAKEIRNRYFRSHSFTWRQEIPIIDHN
jgi:hypothetical protein